MAHYSRLIITGADGFVGNRLLARIKAAFPNTRVIAAVRPKDGRPLSLPNADQTISFDLNSTKHEDFISDLQPDGVVHLAAQASVAASFSNPLESWNTNLIGTVKFAEAICRYRPNCRFVFASTAEIYGLSFQRSLPLDETASLCPTNPYAASKAACDLAIGEMALRGLDAVRIRAFNHTGVGQSDKFVVASFAKQIARMELGLQAPVIQVGALDRWRDFLDVDDVCSAYEAALMAESVTDAVYNIATGKARRIGDILNALLEKSYVVPKIETEVTRMRPTDVERVSGNWDKAAKNLNWYPTVPWEETLARVLQDWRKRVAHPSINDLP